MPVRTGGAAAGIGVLRAGGVPLASDALAISARRVARVTGIASCEVARQSVSGASGDALVDARMSAWVHWRGRSQRGA
jgi:hypothetical protein